MHLRDGDFYAEVPTTSGWTHIVLNYLSPSEGGAVRIYLDGVQAGSGGTKNATSLSPGEGRVVVGRAYTDLDVHYASVDIDELLFFNEKLNEDIFNMY